MGSNPGPKPYLSEEELLQTLGMIKLVKMYLVLLSSMCSKKENIL